MAVFVKILKNKCAYDVFKPSQLIFSAVMDTDTVMVLVMVLVMVTDTVTETVTDRVRYVMDTDMDTVTETVTDMDSGHRHKKDISIPYYNQHELVSLLTVKSSQKILKQDISLLRHQGAIFLGF
jgi:hypothetical protein